MTTSFSFKKNSSSCADDLNEIIAGKMNNTDWLQAFRLATLNDYLAQTMPSRKIEHWKYNEMAFLSQSKFIITNQEEKQREKQVPPLPPQTPTLSGSTILLLINGRFCRETSEKLSSGNSPLAGISATLFSQANPQQQQNILSYLNKTKQNKNSLLQLNSALSTDGLLIEIEQDLILETPIYLLQVNDLDQQQEISTSQVIIHCGSNSQCQIIEYFVSNNHSSQGLSLQQTILDLAENSQCHYYRLNQEASSFRQISRLVTLLNKNSQLDSFFYSEGSLLNKTDIDILHQGENSNSQLTGIYLPSKNQSIDYHTNIEHQVANSTSQEIFRGIIADSAKATFNGKIHIFKNAQKSDAQLSNKNLLLSNQAEINTKPELEIYADDVICSHGATVAKIDDDAIYYLRTRGIGKIQAQKMLSIGFVNELLNKIKHDEIKSLVKKQVYIGLSVI